METALFDVQSGFGGANRGETQTVTVETCLAYLDRLSIQGALVRTEPDGAEVDVILANEALFGACAGRHPRLVPCPIALPATGGDVPSEVEQIDGFIRQGAGAVVIRPGQDDWPLVPFVCDRLLAAVAARGLPLYCLERYVSLQQVAELAGRYPQLPLIVANVAYRSQRTLLPLLEGYPNVYLALGNNFTVHRGIEQMVERLGPRQLLFGTGFPAAEPMMAVTQLMFAEIAPHAKTQIGSGNFARLQEGICRGD